MRGIGAWILTVLVALAAAQARAEGVNSATQDASTGERIRGADTILLRGGGLISLGGAALRYRAKGSPRWETLHRQPSDSLYRADADDSGRVLASWEKDPAIHFFTLKPRQHVVLPKPALPSDVRFGNVDELAFSPNGRDALVFMSGYLSYFMEGSKTFVGERHWNAAYRIALDGKSQPELLFRVDNGFMLGTTVNGAVFIMPKKVGQPCNNITCDPVQSVVGYAITPDGVLQTTLLTEEQVPLSNARLVPGSNDERAVLMLDLEKNGRALLRWRYGDAKADYRPLSPSRGWISSDEFHHVTLVTQKDELIEMLQKDGGVWLVHHPPEGGEEAIRLPASKGMNTRLRDIGLRAKGGIWMHIGDHLVLYTPGKPLRRFNIEPYLERLTEWADVDVYDPSPESLWVGLEVRRSRDFFRLSFADIEKRATLWH